MNCHHITHPDASAKLLDGKYNRDRGRSGPSATANMTDRSKDDSCRRNDGQRHLMGAGGDRSEIIKGLWREKLGRQNDDDRHLCSAPVHRHSHDPTSFLRNLPLSSPLRRPTTMTTIPSLANALSLSTADSRYTATGGQIAQGKIVLRPPQKTQRFDNKILYSRVLCSD